MGTHNQVHYNNEPRSEHTLNVICQCEDLLSSLRGNVSGVFGRGFFIPRIHSPDFPPTAFISPF